MGITFGRSARPNVIPNMPRNLDVCDQGSTYQLSSWQSHWTLCGALHSVRCLEWKGGTKGTCLSNITLLIVLGNGHEHIRAIFQQDMEAATEVAPFKSDRILVQAYLERDLQLLLVDEQRTGAIDSAVALAAQSNLKRGNPRSTPHCTNCKRVGHISDRCI